MKNKKYVGIGDLQLPILVLVFLLCLSVLLPLFSRCRELSEDNFAKNTAVQLCRSAAEAFAAAPDEEGVSRLLGGDGGSSLAYDGEGELCAQEEATFLLSVSIEEENTARGVLRTGVFTAIRRGEVIYSLESSRYVPEGGEQHG